jgi:hypothetical protein
MGDTGRRRRGTEAAAQRARTGVEAAWTGLAERCTRDGEGSASDEVLGWLRARASASVRSSGLAGAAWRRHGGGRQLGLASGGGGARQAVGWGSYTRQRPPPSPAYRSIARSDGVTTRRVPLVSGKEFKRNTKTRFPAQEK